MTRILISFLHLPMLVTAAVWIMLTAASALASPVLVADLVIERAKIDLGPEMPENGRFEIYFSADAPRVGLLIREFWIDHQTGQFIANLVTEEGDLRRISGTAILNLPVPVTTRRLLPDEIITEDDLETTHLPWQRVHAFAVLSPDDLIGKQVRRMIEQGRPVQMRSVIPPIVISRGESVKIVFRNGALQLTTTGKAITEAHLGQEVRVVNLSSNKTIVAIARGNGLVEARQ